MKQGTTPTHTFTLPFETDVVAKVRVLYAQNGKLKIVKTETDATKEGNTISVKLTQEETFRLHHSFPTEIQIRVLTLSKEAFVSDVFSVPTDQCFSYEVL